MTHHTPEERRDRQSARARTLIPGGCHTYAKGDDQYPVSAPGFIARGKGCHVWDLDGREYIEYGMGLRAVTLGHAFEPVVAAAMEQLPLGSNFTRPAPVEVECAERLVSLIDAADQVKFAKDGSTVVTASLRLARAFTARDRVVHCRDHPFFSYNDWFIGSYAMSAGIPRQHRELVSTFRYNDLESLARLFARYSGEIACVVMEPERDVPPEEGFLQGVRELTREHGALLVFDEMITGFRWDIGGAQRVHGIEPDLSAFGKALANGFSVSALAGKREVMQLGGWDHDRERVFLLSTTHGAETHALAAATATMNFYAENDVIGRLHAQGRRLQEGCTQVARAHGLQDHFQVTGRPCNLVYVTRDADGRPSQEFRTLFMQEMLKSGILGPSFVVSYSHSDDDIDRTVEAVSRALEPYAAGLNEGIDRVLTSRPVRPVDRRLAP